jgi:hypothetical protein
VEHLATGHEDRQEPVDGGTSRRGDRPVARPPAPGPIEYRRRDRDELFCQTTVVVARRPEKVLHGAVERPPVQRRPGDVVVRTRTCQALS